MSFTAARSQTAARVIALVETLQGRYVDGLRAFDGEEPEKRTWLRDEGRHGGGVRFGLEDTSRIDRASVNVSQVHYEDEPQLKLKSATALSTIVHPVHPQLPSTHLHISWTQMKDGQSHWRLMADLNPALPNPLQRDRFEKRFAGAAPAHVAEAIQAGERYFFIPALQRKRGIAHFYMERFNSGDFEADRTLAERFGHYVTTAYLSLLHDVSQGLGEPTSKERAAQLAYHTLYFFQVLTLDRGTTAGLLAHDQNDAGVLGSLPGRIDKSLLGSWIARLPEPQNQLLMDLLTVLPPGGTCTVDEALKGRLAQVVRAHYQTHPEALALQAAV